MGCGASHHPISPTASQYPRKCQEDKPSMYSSFVQWKILPSLTEARRNFEDDGTSQSFEDPGHIELRCLLDDPTGQHALGKYADDIQVLDVFFCWVDIQEYKFIPAESYRRSKALHIYYKYIKEDSELSYKKLNNIQRQFYRQQLTSNKLASNTYDELQKKCFLDMYENIYRPFKNSREFVELTESLKYKYNNVRPSHFEYYGKLGEGAFGFVIHCKKKSTGKHYAMKIQTKLGLLHNCRDDLSKVSLEKLACASCQHPFITNLDYAFQTDSLAIMVLNLATAGDLNKSLSNCLNSRMDEDRVRFYAAEIVLALSYLHQMGLIYRDLKPQNVLLHEDGHIQLVDLGGVRDMRGQNLIQYTSSVPLLAQSFIKHIPTTSSNQNSLSEQSSAMLHADDATAADVVTNASMKHHSRVIDSNSSEKGELDFHYEKDDVIEALIHEDDGDEGEREGEALDTSPISGKKDIQHDHGHKHLLPNPSQRKKTHKKKSNGNEDRSARHRFSVTGTLGYMAPEMVLLLNNRRKPNKPRQQHGGGGGAEADVVDDPVVDSGKQFTALRQSRGYSTAVDWWSLGCTIFKLLTGGRPFVDGDPCDLVTVSGELNQSSLSIKSIIAIIMLIILDDAYDDD